MKLYPLVLLSVASFVAVPAMADGDSGSAPEGAALEAPAPVGVRSPAYRIQPGDVLSISVWKETDLQADVMVRPDGGISFPLAGDQVAEGRTIDDLRKVLVEKLKKYIPDPVVTVAVRALGGNRIYVIGKVARPGDFPFSRPLDVMQSLTLAGGATSFADVNDIRILRRGENGKQVMLSFKYDDVSRGRHLEQNVLLQTGDTVVVP
ncbi:MAG: polysaccharide biosynthesis/export family protein [Gammaproteobacteria bacterium]